MAGTRPLLFLVIAIITTMMVTMTYAEETEKLEYGVMIDAGSSGTRVFLYSWQYRELDADSEQIGPLSRPITQEGWSKKFNIPISDYARKPDLVGELLDKTVDFAQTTLTQNKVSNFTKIPIFLGATAGARLLSQVERVALFKSIRAYYHSDQSPFQFRDHYAKVLSGEEEGFFGFLAVNYMTGKIYPSEPKQVTEQAVLYGALDMGGASTQITFDTRGDDVLEDYFEYSTPDEQRYGIYTTSFLQFGMNQWWERLNDRATQDKPTATSVIMSCLGEGFEYEWTNTRTQVKYIVKGAPGNLWTTCRTDNQALLFLDTPCLTDSCSVNGSYQPRLPDNTEVFAFSGFVNVVASYDPTFDQTKSYSIEKFRSLGQDICNLSMAELRQRFPKVDLNLLPRGCAALAYFYSLTNDAYHFPSQTEFLRLIKDIDGTEVSWALGRMVYEVNLRSYERILPSVPGNITFWIAIAILMAVLGGVITLLISTWSKMNKDNQSGMAFQSLDSQDYQATNSTNASGYV